MRNHPLYAAFAVILPVALGLGLVYLSSVGRIDGYLAVASTLGIAAAIAVGIYLRDTAARGDMGELDRIDR